MRPGQGQLAGIGIEISKRQVVRLLTSRLDDLIAEDRDVLRAGLATAGGFVRTRARPDDVR